MKVRTRFAPSPTGYQHVGGLRTALFAWLVARQKGGDFILRIEDTDKNREVAGSEQHVMECLDWLGLEWNEGPDKGGEYGPYRQSERLDIYKEWAQKLIDKGRAYADPTTPKQLDTLRDAAKQQKKPFLFRDHRPKESPTWDGKAPLRFKSNPKAYEWDEVLNDLVMGEIGFGEEAIDDFILIKSDGYPTYNFAHIVDDHLMGITHVIRSQEFLPSVPKYLNLYEAFEIKRPIFATLPYVMGPDGNKKLSKRDGAKDILDYRAEGYLPEALTNFLATMGWNDGSEQEIYTLDELIKKFKLERVQRSGARFDEQRLVWMNGHYIRELPAEELYGHIESFWPAEAKKADEGYKKAVLALVQERLKFFSELSILTDFFFKEPAVSEVMELYVNPADKQLKKSGSGPEYKKMLSATLEQLEQSDFGEADIQKRLNNLLETLSTKPAILFPVIRIAVSGKQFSPELFGTLSVLGKDRTISRIKKVVSALEK